MVQYSPDHMKWMGLIRVRQVAQKKVDLTEKLFNEIQEKPDEPEPNDRKFANEESSIEQISRRT
jgi:hypothetical protein